MENQKINHERYLESLKNTPGPIPPSKLPKIKMDLQGLSNYAKSKGVSVNELSQEEIDRFTKL